jgi:hypothetical protein
MAALAGNIGERHVLVFLGLPLAGGVALGVESGPPGLFNASF